MLDLLCGVLKRRGCREIHHCSILNTGETTRGASARRRVPAKQKFETFLQAGVLLEKFHLFTVQLCHFAGE
jgi:hypothetical protein